MTSSFGQARYQPGGIRMLDREEYIEQSYLFRMIAERLPDNNPLQDILQQMRYEVLATTKLPMAIDFYWRS